jgi:hypothetical protein
MLEYQISEKSFQWKPILQCGQTEGHDEADSLFSQFCERA